VAACFLASCLPSSAGVRRAPDLSTLEMDPAKFMRIALRNDVQVGMAEIQAGKGAAPGTRWYLVGYREHTNRKGFVPDRETEYANLFLVSEVQRLGERGIVKSRYLVVESWRYYPTQRIKTCHQWTIWEDDPETAPTRASFQLLVEDLNNVFLGDRRAPLDSPTLKHLGDFYLKVKRVLGERVKGLPGELAYRN